MRRSAIDSPLRNPIGTRPAHLHRRTFHVPNLTELAVCRYISHLRNQYLMRFDAISDRLEVLLARREMRNPIPQRGKYVRPRTRGARMVRMPNGSQRWRLRREWTAERCEQAYASLPGLLRTWMRVRTFHRQVIRGQQLSEEAFLELLAARPLRCGCGAKCQATSWGWYCVDCRELFTPGHSELE